MSVTYPVFFYDSTQTGAPRVAGVAGDRIATLDACLVTGFNTKTITITRTGDVATATCNGHGYRAQDILLIAGADQSAYNGLCRISNVGANTFDFAVTGSPATPATGAITAKVAPAGWEKRFSGTNKAVYRSSDVASTRLNLYMDDSNAQYAIVRGYEDMTGASDIGTGPFPTVAQLANGGYWMGSSAANSTARTWVLICDGRFLYFLVAWHGTYVQQYMEYRFGDIISCKSGDAFHCLLTAEAASNPSYPGSPFHPLDVGNLSSYAHFARAATQIGGSVNGLYQRGPAEQNSKLGASGYTYPNSANNGLLLYWPIRLSEGTTIFRGTLPGMIAPLHAVPLDTLTVVTDVPGLSDRRLLAMKIGSTSSGQGQVLYDITGPWR